MIVYRYTHTGRSIHDLSHSPISSIVQRFAPGSSPDAVFVPPGPKHLFVSWLLLSAAWILLFFVLVAADILVCLGSS